MLEKTISPLNADFPSSKLLFPSKIKWKSSDTLPFLLRKIRTQLIHLYQQPALCMISIKNPDIFSQNDIDN